VLVVLACARKYSCVIVVLGNGTSVASLLASILETYPSRSARSATLIFLRKPSCRWPAFEQIAIVQGEIVHLQNQPAQPFAKRRQRILDVRAVLRRTPETKLVKTANLRGASNQ
jgi:hypothetical protein